MAYMTPIQRRQNKQNDIGNSKYITPYQRRKLAEPPKTKPDIERIRAERLEPEVNPSYKPGDYTKYVEEQKKHIVNDTAVDSDMLRSENLPRRQAQASNVVAEQSSQNLATLNREVPQKPSDDFSSKSKIEQVFEALGKIPESILNKEDRRKITTNIDKAIWGESGTTPERNEALENLWINRTIPVYEEDSPQNKLRKDIANIGLGVAGNVAGAIGQAQMQLFSAIDDLANGRPLDTSQKEFMKDIAPEEWDTALTEYGKTNPLGEQAIRMGVGTATDIGTYIGGIGIADDLAKAGLIGKASRPSTEAVKLAAERQSGFRLPNTQVDAPSADEVVPEINTVEPVPIRSNNDEMIDENYIKAIYDAFEANGRKPLPSDWKPGDPVPNAKPQDIKKLELELQDEITTPRPQESEKIAEELRGLSNEETQPISNRLEGTQAQLFNVYTSNLNGIAKESGLDMSGLYTKLKEVNAFNPSLEDVETIISEYKKIFTESQNPKVNEYINALNNIRNKASAKTQPVSADSVLENMEPPSAGNIGSVNSQGKTTMAERELSTTGKDSLISDRKVKAYMYENPEVKDYYQTIARYILDDEFVPNEQVSRVTEVMQMLKSDTGLKPGEIKDALERLVKNHGQENVAAAKRIELVIDDMLTNGFESVRGEKVPPIDDYIKLKSEIEGRDISPRAAATLDDVPAETDYARPVERNAPDTKIKDTDQIGLPGVNVRDIKGKDGTVEKMISPYGQAWKDAEGWNVDINGKTSRAANEDEARRLIDSGTERTEVKPKKAEELKQMEIGEYKPNSDNVDTPENKSFVAEYKKTLPETETEVRKAIDDLKQLAKLEKDESKLLKINLQLFAADEKLQEVSKIKTNTLKKAPALQDDEIQKAIEEIDMTYGVKVNKDVAEFGKKVAEIANDFTIENLRKNGLKSAEDTATAFFITKKLAVEAKASGDYTKLKSFLKGVQQSATEQGQTIQAFKIWQQDPDGMLKNATKVVEDAENAAKKSNPEKIKQIDKETNAIIDAMDKTEKEAVDQIVDEVNKKAGEIKGKGKQGESTPGKTKTDKEDLTPEEMLANKIETYTKDPKVPEDDPIKYMINELFRIAKESPIERKKVQSKSAIEFVSEALSNRQQYVETWKKAKEIVREKLKDNPEALAKLEAYFDKGIKPPFSSDSFNKSIRDGMKALDQDLGKIVRDYYAIGSKSRDDLSQYLIKKSGLSGEDAEVLAKYVQNRMKELTKDKKEQILKGIFKNETVKTPKPGAIKSIEELSNVGAFVNENYKARVMEKLNPRLQKLINENFKGNPVMKAAEAGVDNRIDFGELVRKSVEEIDFTRTKFLKEISEKLQVNDTDAKTILRAIEQRFDEIVKEKRQTILGNMFKKREPAVKKTGIQRVQEYIDKQVELENLGANPDAIRDFIKEKYGLPTLTNDDMAFITENIDKLKGLDQGTRPYNETLWRIYNRIESKVPSTFIDKFRAWQRISMLPNAKTFTRNILGNVFMEKMENLNELTTTALVDLIASAFTKKRTVLGPTAAVKKSIAQTKGKVQGLTDVLTDIKHKVNTYDVQGQYEINVSKNAFKNPALNALEQFTNKTLQFGDRPFYEAAKARRLEELKILRKTKDITDDMEADAILYALDRTFQNDSFLSGKIQQIKTGKTGKEHNVVYEAIANIVIPFARTPANILDKLSDYTPIGLIKAVGHLGKTAGKGTFDQLYFSQRLGRMLTGSGIVALGYILADKGVITGKSDKTTTKAGAFKRDIGERGYSIKTPNGYVSYDWAQPVGSLLALGADAYNNGMDKEGFINKALSGVEGAGNTFFNMSMLQSLNSLMGYGNPMGGFINTMLDSTQQFNPTAMKQAAKIFDEYERETYDPNKLKEVYNKIIANVPELRKVLPEKTDSFGQPVEVQEGYGTAQKLFNIAANPALVTKYTMTDYEKEIKRLYEIDKNTAVLPSVADGSFTHDKTEYVMTAKELEKYKKTYGNTILNGTEKSSGLKSLINSTLYNKADDKKKTELIKKRYSIAEDAAKEELLKSRGIKLK